VRTEGTTGVRIIGVEPAHRQHTLSGIKRITGLPSEHEPKILDRSVIDDIIAVEDRDAYEAGIRLARTEGVMVGPTTGALLHAAIQLGATSSGTAVVISPDNAMKYVSSYARYLETPA
jgi:cysteine synthase